MVTAIVREARVTVGDAGPVELDEPSVVERCVGITQRIAIAVAMSREYSLLRLYTTQELAFNNWGKC
jgi:hypothetical protein